MYETSCQSRFDARYWMLGAGALGCLLPHSRQKGRGLLEPPAGGTLPGTPEAGQNRDEAQAGSSLGASLTSISGRIRRSTYLRLQLLAQEEHRLSQSGTKWNYNHTYAL